MRVKISTTDFVTWIEVGDTVIEVVPSEDGYQVSYFQVRPGESWEAARLRQPDAFLEEEGEVTINVD